MFAPNNGLDGLDAAAAAPNAAAVLESMPNNVVDLLPVPPPPPNEKGVDDGVGVAPSSVTMPVAVGTLTEEKNPPSAEGADADVFAVEAAEPNTAPVPVPPVPAPVPPSPDPAQLSAFLVAPKSILMAFDDDDDDGGDMEKENAAGAGAGAALVWFASLRADFTSSFAPSLLAPPASLRAAASF